MKKISKKALALCISAAVTGSAFSVSAVAVDESIMLRFQAESLISSVNENELILAAKNNAIDYSVPLEIRKNTIADAKFIPCAGVKQDAIKLEVNSTVQKVGEIARSNGDKATMYVAAAEVSEVKEDKNTELKNGIQAWAYVYWIDILGTKNELYAVSASWDPKGQEVDSRIVTYGTSDISGFLWYDYESQYPSTNSAYYDDLDYVGLTLRCESYINVINKGAVTCNVTSKFVT